MPSFYRARWVSSARELSTAALLCHTFRHAWDDPPVTEAIFSDGVVTWQMVSTCERCAAERKDYLSTDTMEVWSRNYTYPDGYLLSVPATTVDFRAELVRRNRRRVRKPSRRRAG